MFEYVYECTTKNFICMYMQKIRIKNKVVDTILNGTTFSHFLFPPSLGYRNTSDFFVFWSWRDKVQASITEWFERQIQCLWERHLSIRKEILKFEVQDFCYSSNFSDREWVHPIVSNDRQQTKYRCFSTYDGVTPL